MDAFFETIDAQNTIITALIGLTTFYFYKFYAGVKSLPPGPVPLPVVGNILSLHGTKEHFALELAKLKDKYGSVVTFWIGNTPSVIVFDSELARETFKRNDFSERPETLFGNLFSNDKSSDVLFDDYGKRWECLRKVAHSAVRKFASTDKLKHLVSEVVDETVAEIKQKEGIDKPFNIIDYNYNIILNIIAESAFGKRYNDSNDPEYKQIKYFFSDFQTEVGPVFGLIQFLPLTRVWFNTKVGYFKKTVENFRDLIKNKYQEHYKDYYENNIRDFCDSVIFAKNEAKESVEYLTDENLALVIVDLFTAGLDTTKTTLNWITLFMANYPEMQNKMRQEIQSVIGDRMPAQEDKNYCHYVNAFISEVMRYRPIVPLVLLHKSVVQSKIGEYTIPANTMISYHQYCILNDPKYWDNPQEFRPERFIENGKYVTSEHLIPFGTGRRMCLGEDLAIIDIFLIVVRLLQTTSNYEIALDGGPGSADLNVDNTLPDTARPNPYKIVLKSKT